MSGLRDELLSLGKELPDLRLLLPAGWRASSLQQAGVDELVRRLRATLMAAHRPDVDAVSDRRSSKVDRGAACRGRPLHGPSRRSTRRNPLADVAGGVGRHRRRRSVRRSWVVEKIRSGTTEFLDENRTVLTWTTTTPGRDEMAGTVSDRFDYVIPVPGTSRRSALVLSGDQPLARFDRRRRSAPRRGTHPLRLHRARRGLGARALTVSRPPRPSGGIVPIRVRAGVGYVGVTGPDAVGFSD